MSASRIIHAWASLFFLPTIFYFLYFIIFFIIESTNCESNKQIAKTIQWMTDGSFLFSFFFYLSMHCENRLWAIPANPNVSIACISHSWMSNFFFVCFQCTNSTKWCEQLINHVWCVCIFFAAIDKFIIIYRRCQ